MIPDFKTYIGESVWGGMLSRSAGDTIRKEDDINLLDQDGLYDYLTSHYKNTNSFIHIYNSSDTIGVPFLIQGGFDSVYLNFEENEVSIPYASPYKVNGLFSKLRNEFSLKSDSKTGHTWYIISPKDGSEVTNTFFIYVIDFLIDNIPDSFEKGVKKIVNESVWGGMLDRSTGDTIRKEDDVNLLDDEGFCEYLKSKYYIDNSVEQRPSKIFIQKFNNGGSFIDVPLFVFNGKNVNNVQDCSSFTYYPDIPEIGFGCTSRKYCRIFLELLNERFAIKGSGIICDMKTQCFKGDITNRTLVEMIDFVIDNIKKPLIPIIVKK